MPIFEDFFFEKFQKRCYGLVFRVKFLGCANVCPNWTCRIQVTSQNVILLQLQGQVASLCHFLSTSDLRDPKDKPKRDFWVKFLPLTSPCEVKFANFEKTPLRAGSQGQVASLCQCLSTSDLPDPNDKPKRDFGAKLGQILTFDLSVRGQICKF
jgi:hypothetical protein